LPAAYALRVKLLRALLLLLIALAATGREPNPHVRMMKATFRIQQQQVPTGDTVAMNWGTAFLLALPRPPGDSARRFIMVTAEHVLERMDAADHAQLCLRRRLAGGEYAREYVGFRVRTGGTPYWTALEDSSTDVAALFVELPASVEVESLRMTDLADDDDLEEYAVHAGGELYSLGFPLFQGSNEFEFPVLRRGVIASYPVTPTDRFPNMSYDADLRPGDSGGPVYFTRHSNPGTTAAEPGTERNLHRIVGLVSRRSEHPEWLSASGDEPLKVAVVVTAPQVKRTVQKLLAENE